MSKFVTQDGIERLIGIVKSELDGKISIGNSSNEEITINSTETLFNINTVTNGYGLNTDGTISANEGWSVTDYIDVTEGKNYLINDTEGYLFGSYVCFYDETNTFISYIRFRGLADVFINIPSGVSKIRFDFPTDRINYITFKLLTISSHQENEIIHVSPKDRDYWNYKINAPETEGTSGQVLMTDGNGGRTWTTLVPWESVSVLTQAEYDAITTPVSTTLYLIKEA